MRGYNTWTFVDFVPDGDEDVVGVDEPAQGREDVEQGDEEDVLAEAILTIQVAFGDVQGQHGDANDIQDFKQTDLKCDVELDV